MTIRTLRRALSHVLVTLVHKVRVGHYMVAFAARILYRAFWHDNSKLRQPELAVFADAPTGPYDTPYASPQYFENLEKLSQALLHHYAHNRHHPEHYDKGVSGMNLLDLVEMVSDWQATTNSHDGSNLRNIVTASQQRFGMSDDLSAILYNSMSTACGPRAQD